MPRKARKGRRRRMSGKANNVVRISCSLDAFFRYWFLFLKPYHNMTDRGIAVAAKLVQSRHELSKSISDPVLLDSVCMSDDNKRRIAKECGISMSNFNVVMSRLRKGKVIVDNRLNPRFIPNLKEEDGQFQLLLYFELK